MIHTGMFGSDIGVKHAMFCDILTNRLLLVYKDYKSSFGLNTLLKSVCLLLFTVKIRIFCHFNFIIACNFYKDKKVRINW